MKAETKTLTDQFIQAAGLTPTRSERDLMYQAMEAVMHKPAQDAAQRQKLHDAGWLESKALLYLDNKQREVHQILKSCAQQLRERPLA